MFDFLRRDRIQELIDDEYNNFYIRIRKGRSDYIFTRGKVDINQIEKPITKYITNIDKQEVIPTRRGRKKKEDNEDNN